MITSLEAIRIFEQGCFIHQFSGVRSGSSCGIDFKRLKTDNNTFEILVMSKDIVDSVRVNIDLNHRLAVESKRIYQHVFYL